MCLLYIIETLGLNRIKLVIIILCIWTSFLFFYFIIIIIIIFIVVDFVIDWNEMATGLRVFPILIPTPTSLSTWSL